MLSHRCHKFNPYPNVYSREKIFLLMGNSKINLIIRLSQLNFQGDKSKIANGKQPLRATKV